MSMWFVNLKVMKNKILLIFSCLLFFGLFVFLELFNSYHFFYMEQFQLFLSTGDYFSSVFFSPGGGCEYISNFLVQFFVLPQLGSLIVSLLVTGIFIGLYGLFRTRMTSSFLSFLFAFLPCFFLVFCHFNSHFLLQGTLAFLFCVCSLVITFRLEKVQLRILFSFVFYFSLFFIAGSISVLYAFCYLIIECTRKKNIYQSLPFLIVTVLCVLLSIRYAFPENSRLAFLPDLYYQVNILPEKIIYFPWIILLLLLLIAPWCCKLRISKYEKFIYPVFIILIVFGFKWGLDQYGNRKLYFLKKLDHYSRMEQWDKIIHELEGGNIRNYLYLNYLNLALAQQGKLVEHLFDYQQNGAQGLFIKWNNTNTIATLLSDISFCVGDIASSQQYAFEGNVLSNPGSGRLIQRLIETNIIFGEYKVADKYIQLLKHTLFYRKWAEEKGQLIKDEKALMQDKLIVYKRNCLPSLEKNKLITVFEGDLIRLTQSSEINSQACEYLVAYYLLNKNIDLLAEFADFYKRSTGNKGLPTIYQQALLALYEQNPEKWAENGITEDTAKSYQEYRRFVMQNEYYPDLDKKMYAKFRKTYWYYLQFV